MRHSPAYVQDEHHHGGWVIIITACGLVLLLLCLLIRLYVRWRYSSTLYAADGVLAVAGFFAIAQSCLVFWEVGEGLGTASRLLTPHARNVLQKAYFATTILYLFTIYLSKCCVIFVYLHLSPAPSIRRAAYAILALATSWVICSELLFGINYSLLQTSSQRKIIQDYGNLFVRVQVVTGWDIAIEILLFLLSILLVAGTQMPLKRKSIVVSAFGTRLLVIVPAILRLHYLYQMTHSSDPAAETASTLVWTQVQLHFSVICSVTYCFRSFSSAISTNYGCAVINLDVYEETNGNLSAYTNMRKPSKTPSRSMDERFTGHGGKYSSSTIITGGARPEQSQTTTSRKSGESTMVIIQEEVHVESSRATPTKELDSESN